jgi:hypothetical protein
MRWIGQVETMQRSQQIASPKQVIRKKSLHKGHCARPIDSEVDKDFALFDEGLSWGNDPVPSFLNSG